MLALTGGLFDTVALERMTDAQRAVQAAAADIAEPVRKRFEMAAKLSDEDRKTITDIAGQALQPFLPKPEANAAASGAARRAEPAS